MTRARKKSFGAAASAAVTLAVTWPVPVTASGLGAPVIEPIVLLERSRIAGCGVEAVFTGQAGRLAISLTIVRDERGSSQRVVRGHWRNVDGIPRQISRIGIATSTRALMAPDDRWSTADDGAAQSREPAATPGDWSAFGGLMQELLVGGGQITIHSPGGTELRLALPGPAAHTVRSSYLNCAGDMFRDER